MRKSLRLTLTAFWGFCAWESAIVSLRPQVPQTFAGSLAKADLLAAPKYGSGVPRQISYQIEYKDVRGRAHKATYEEDTWAGRNYKISWHGDTFDLTIVQDGQIRWVSKSGIMPLKLWEFWLMFPKPWLSIGRLAGEAAAPAVSSIVEDGVALGCFEDKLTAKLCFFELQGWFASGAIDGRLTTYRDWRPVGDKYLPMQVVVESGGKEVLRARGNLDAKPPSGDVTSTIPAGARRDDMSLSGATGVPVVTMLRENSVQIVYQSGWNTSSDSGSVLLAVVPKKDGKAGAIDVLDADSLPLAKQSLHVARSLIFTGPSVKAGEAIPILINRSLQTGHNELRYYAPAWLF